ncbi:MAG: hypothetical protein FWB96_01850 [Defluviitaleaceae bacterium]|nr:hypothetical protein [Defluviitaleaceae bacterium]MCL2262047.1 hypothetical protein [Defluviitaleaceae bacterium]
MTIEYKNHLTVEEFNALRVAVGREDLKCCKSQSAMTKSRKWTTFVNL